MISMFESEISESISDELVSLAREIDQFEGYKNPHGERIAALATALAKSFDFSSEDIETLRKAALIHDIGELVMNRDYIHVDRVLTPRERLDMKRHPVIGEQEIAKKGYSKGVQLLVRWHHEWWNGSGYPDALHGANIPLGARILRVCDTYSALTDERPYSLPVSENQARNFLAEWAGIEFDPKVVFEFLKLREMPELESIVSESVD